MSLIDVPLARAGAAEASVAGPTVRAMEIGQHLLAVVLTAIGVYRAIGDGVAIPAAIATGAAILAWHTAGTILPSRTRSRRIVVWWIIGFAALWGAAVVLSPEFIWLAFLLWLLAGHLLPLAWGLLYSAVVLVVVIAAPVMHHGHTSYANVFGPLIGGVFAYGVSRGYLRLLRDAAERERLVASLTAAQRDMAELQDELARAQREAGAISERTRISRDIHDTVAQSLSSIRLLAHAGTAQTIDADAARTLAQVEALAGESLVDVRRIVAALAPAELEGAALAAALERMLERLRDETGIVGELRIDDSLPAFPTEVEVALLRTAQSALANVRLHANASRVVLSLVVAGRTARLDISDDGVGFDPVSWERSTDTTESGYGLRFMRARLRELGGGIDVESAPGEGTAISVYLPIHAGAGGAADAADVAATSEDSTAAHSDTAEEAS